MRVLQEQACSVDACPNAAVRGGLCWAHAKRKTRGVVVDGSLERRYESQRERLCEAAINYADAADDDVSYQRAWDRLRKAAIAWYEDENMPSVPTVEMMKPSLVAAARRAPRAVSAMQLRLL